MWFYYFLQIQAQILISFEPHSDDLLLFLLNQWCSTNVVLNFLSLRVCKIQKRKRRKWDAKFFQGKSLIQKRRSDQRIEASVAILIHIWKSKSYILYIYIRTTFYADLIFNTLSSEKKPSLIRQFWNREVHLA